jgi:hypothetical protein
LSEISARTLEDMRQAAELVHNLTVGPGLELVKAVGSLHVKLGPEVAGQYVGTITAAIVRNPEPGELILWVRGVRYVDFPPRQDRPGCNDGQEPTCRYEWTGDDFEAYPDFGSRVEDYGPYVWTADGPPRLETPFVRARYENVWIVERPADTMRHVIVRNIPDPDANFITVQDVRPNRVGGSWDGTFIAVGAPWSAATHPKSYAGDYVGFVWPQSDPIEDATPILIAHRESGGWWVSQYVRFTIPERRRGLIVNDCVPQVAAGV